MIRSQICLKAGLAVVLYDDFTGMPIQNQVVFMTSSQGIKPIRKDGGFYVFLNCSDKVMDICVKSPIYRTRHIHVDLENGKKCPVIKVWLLPGSAYPMPFGTTFLEGRAKPNCLIQAACCSPDGALKLLYDYDGGEIISLYQSQHVDLEGRTLYLQDKTKTASAYITVTTCINEPEGLYRLHTPLKIPFLKVETDLYPVYSGVSDQDGFYRILMQKVPMNGCEGICRINTENGEERRKITIQYGGAHRLDW